MKKILFLLAAAGSLASAQTIMIPLILTDGGSYQQTVWFGVDSTASPGIDSTFECETADPPPFPPPGIFTAMFNLPINAMRVCDIRYAPSFPFTGVHVHRLIWQLSEGSPGLLIHYSLPSSVIIQIGDILLYGTGEFLIPSPYYMAQLTIHYNAAIPVELTSFTACASGSEIILSWKTASETNNKGFDIERRQQDDKWEQMAFIPGAGTTAEEHSYSYNDKEVQAGVRYTYRLRQTDYDGTFTLSPEADASVEFPDEYSLKQNYPNPFNSSTVIEYTLPQSGDVVLSIYNSIGELKKEITSPSQPPGNYRIQLGIPYLPSGVYFYRMQSGRFIETKKMILMR